MAYTIIIQRFNMFKGVQPSTSGVRATTELNESSDQRYFQLEGDIWNNFLYDCTLSYKSNTIRQIPSYKMNAYPKNIVKQIILLLLWCYYAIDNGWSEKVDIRWQFRERSFKVNMSIGILMKSTQIIWEWVEKTDVLDSWLAGQTQRCCVGW